MAETAVRFPIIVAAAAGSTAATAVARTIAAARTIVVARTIAAARMTVVARTIAGVTRCPDVAGKIAARENGTKGAIAAVRRKGMTMTTAAVRREETMTARVPA